jgi:hypothetical protein
MGVLMIPSCLGAKYDSIIGISVLRPKRKEKSISSQGWEGGEKARGGLFQAQPSY